MKADSRLSRCQSRHVNRRGRRPRRVDRMVRIGLPCSWPAWPDTSERSSRRRCFRSRWASTARQPAAIEVLPQNDQQLGFYAIAMLYGAGTAAIAGLIPFGGCGHPAARPAIARARGASVMGLAGAATGGSRDRILVRRQRPAQLRLVCRRGGCHGIRWRLVGGLAVGAFHVKQPPQLAPPSVSRETRSRRRLPNAFHVERSSSAEVGSRKCGSRHAANRLRNLRLPPSTSRFPLAHSIGLITNPLSSFG